MSVWYYVTFGTMGALMGAYWDIYFAWGCCRSMEPGKQFIRHKFLYPRWIYYQAFFTNFFFRFSWVMNIIPKDIQPDWMKNTDFLYMMQGFLNCCRGIQWIMIRVENENINNFEKYRNILEIPPIMDEDQPEEDEGPFKK
mmetsp:Transcript_17641/g.16876  ORF Transcript_17641/g.16876 Transcript_17641/m.16876 type:complete len:140 (-) Transcript_17641:26-445(-)